MPNSHKILICSPVSKRQLGASEIDCQVFADTLQRINPPAISENIDNLVDELNSDLYRAASSAKVTNDYGTTAAGDRWERLLNSNDSKVIWRAIDWGGSITQCAKQVRPTDQEFKDHFEMLLNPIDAPPLCVPDTYQSPYIPVTDDPIKPQEVIDAINWVKGDKAGGPSGVTPRCLKFLPESWISFLTVLFTLIFTVGQYPGFWGIARLVAIFKKGITTCCNNYRGIAIMDSIAKLYDWILCKRLEKWFKPDREQAGSQRGRRCIEHIATLRLLVDYALHKRYKLFVTFVDFSKAYDTVPRNALTQVMKSLGCVAGMLCATALMYSNTKFVFGTALITTAVGVRQGSPTSCLLFTLYVNGLIRNLKDCCATDGYLSWLHSLMFMDDTVILATNRDRCQEKLAILMDYCKTSGMKINADKTKFMVINGTVEDKQPFVVAGQTIKNGEVYTYLGSIFSQDGKISSAIKAHCKAKSNQIYKFQSFLTKIRICLYGRRKSCPMLLSYPQFCMDAKDGFVGA